MRADPTIEGLLLLDALSRLEFAERNGDRHPLHTRRSVAEHARLLATDLASRDITPPSEILRLAASQDVNLFDAMQGLRAFVNATAGSELRIVINGYSSPTFMGAIHMESTLDLVTERFFPTPNMIDDTGLRENDTGDEVGPFRQWLGDMTEIIVSERAFSEPPRLRSQAD